MGNIICRTIWSLKSNRPDFLLLELIKLPFWTPVLLAVQMHVSRIKGTLYALISLVTQAFKAFNIHDEQRLWFSFMVKISKLCILQVRQRSRSEWLQSLIKKKLIIITKNDRVAMKWRQVFCFQLPISSDWFDVAYGSKCKLNDICSFASASSFGGARSQECNRRKAGVAIYIYTYIYR